MDYFNWSKTLTIALVGTIGFIGVDQIRALALRFLGNRFGGGNPQA
ncbi:phage holin family protein [Candidatus Symbiopectobacterium endolongispinus]